MNASLTLACLRIQILSKNQHDKDNYYTLQAFQACQSIKFEIRKTEGSVLTLTTYAKNLSHSLKAM